MSYRYRKRRLKRVKKQTGDGEMSGAGSKGWADAKSNISWADKTPPKKPAPVVSLAGIALLAENFTCFTCSGDLARAGELGVI